MPDQPTGPVLRALQAVDLDRLMDLQRAAYGPHFLEPAPVLARRLAVAPDTAWVLEDRPGLCAYLVAYRSRLGRVTPLHAVFEPAPDADTLYLHDLAVHPAAAGQGLGPRLVAHALAQTRAQGLRFAALVAVQGSQAFWGRQGFAAGRVAAEALSALHGYGPQATYMVHPLQAPG